LSTNFIYTVRYRESLIYTKSLHQLVFITTYGFLSVQILMSMPIRTFNCLVHNFFPLSGHFCSVRGIDTLLVTPPRLALYIGFDKYTRRQRSSFPSEEKAGHASPIAEFAFYFSWRGACPSRFSSRMHFAAKVISRKP
jgi:hypothetical protein